MLHLCVDFVLVLTNLVTESHHCAVLCALVFLHTPSLSTFKNCFTLYTIAIYLNVLFCHPACTSYVTALCHVHEPSCFTCLYTSPWPWTCAWTLFICCVNILHEVLPWTWLTWVLHFKLQYAELFCLCTFMNTLPIINLSCHMYAWFESMLVHIHWSP